MFWSPLKQSFVHFQGGTSEVDREQARQDQQEENYSFVFGQNKLSDYSSVDSFTDTVTGTVGESSTQSEAGIQSETSSQNVAAGAQPIKDSRDSYLNTEDEES